ncbi:inhibin alpha chain isoform X1 [Chiloscyllium plagiosum]|uniref:inhibin alpha chain isoform X1 n=2 Tax=Chiloscyllium plagiosum TaxID=36176 RepID=UPI001CB83B7D|nr:inhibin alpha chain isoform X1 [Chiloscyllium plagiosum]
MSGLHTSHKLPAIPLFLNLLGMVLLILMFQIPTLKAACSMHSLSEDAIIVKVQEKILQSLGLTEPPENCNVTSHELRNPFKSRKLARRITRWIGHQKPNKDSDKSEIISFPITNIPCDLQYEGFVGNYSYIFQPSLHSRRNQVTSAEFWFYTGVQLTPGGDHPAELYFLTEPGIFARAAESMVVEGQWVIFHVSQSFLSYISHKILFLQVKCASCQCVRDQVNVPFILSTAKNSGSSRSRRSTVPWSPAYVSLLQRPPSPELIHDDCHRSAVNISFEELGWGNWIVQPSVFTFYYCNGTCSNSNRLTSSLGLKVCCTSVPGTMKPLRVRTTSDSGYTFKYETIPNIITEECACI